MFYYEKNEQWFLSQLRGNIILLGSCRRHITGSVAASFGQEEKSLVYIFAFIKEKVFCQAWWEEQFGHSC